MTKSDLVLLAAYLLGEGTFGYRRLAFEAWTRWPQKFGVAGYKSHMDTHTVLVCLSQKRGPVKIGYIERVGLDAFTLTGPGRLKAADLYRQMKEQSC